MHAEADASVSPTPSFLVIRRDNIGDLVCTTPLFRALRQRYPRARICVLANSYNAPVLQNNLDLDQVYAYTKLKHRVEGSGAWRLLWNRIAMLISLRHQRFDYAIFAGTRFFPRGLRLARLIRPRHVIGFAGHGDNVSRVLDMAIPLESPRPMHEVENAFRMLEPLAIRGEPPGMRIVPNADEVQRIRARIATQDG